MGKKSFGTGAVGRKSFGTGAVGRKSFGTWAAGKKFWYRGGGDKLPPPRKGGRVGQKGSKTPCLGGGESLL